jgi:glycerophosphoryl diester phosphodiesterase
MEYVSKDNMYVKARLYESKDWNSDFNYIDGEFYRDFIKNKYIAIAINSECLNKDRVEYLKSKFFKVFVYSAKTDCQVKELLDYGVDSIFVDKKEQLNLV